MAEAQRFSILVVEDNDAIRAAIERSLARRGCIVATAINGVQGLERIRAATFDAVVADLMTPEHGGLWLWREALRLRPELRGRFVLVSPQLSTRETGMELFLQSEHLFVKPFALDGLVLEVEEIAHRARSGAGAPGSGHVPQGERQGTPDGSDHREPLLDPGDARER